MTPLSLLASGILLVLLDDIGIEAIGSYGVGPTPANTPTLNMLATSGVQFENFYAQPLCSPSRVQIHTGLDSFRTGQGTLVGGPQQPWVIPLAELTLPGLLGRETAAFGKWHMSKDLAGPHSVYQHFDGTIGQLKGDYTGWNRLIDGQVSFELGYATSVTTDAALAWISSRTGPWFAYVAYHAAHKPLHRPPAHLYSGSLPNPFPTANEDPLLYWRAMIEALDTELGRLLAGVDLNTTTVLILGDNGSPSDLVTGPFPVGRGKGTVYQGGIRVPAWALGAGVVPHVESNLVQISDLHATVIELAGGSFETQDSLSFASYLGSPSAAPRRERVLTEHFEPNGPGPYTVERRALIREGWKLITHESPPDELYDLSVDPWEASPVALPHAMHEELRAMLEEVLSGG